VGGVESDLHASQSYATNFHRHAPPEEFKLHEEAKDITDPKNAPDVLLRRLTHEPPEEAVDFIIGGPPCPSFARVGRAKLRKVHAHEEAFLRDPRALLYRHYIRYIATLSPIAVVMENVPDILNWGGENLGEVISRELEALGYVCAYTLLNAAHYGVPQMRERFILIGIHHAANAAPAFPAPTHRVDLPPGYYGSRRVALKHIQLEPLQDISGHYWRPPMPSLKLPPAVSADQALRDLPRLFDHLSGLDKRGARRFNLKMMYRQGTRPTAYARLMRKWPGFESPGYVVDHVTRCLGERDFPIFRDMRQGGEYPQAHAIALGFFQKALEENGNPRRGSALWKKLRKRHVPPYNVENFPNKWRKIEEALPVRTLMAHLGKDTYSHIHYDSEQARTITVREAARLQSFPDGFVFRGTMNPAFRQIGNSVPPLFSYAICRQLLTSLQLPIGSQVDESHDTQLALELPQVANSG
jgi:DNA (cytosine-5)-methyltransferase 1